MDTTTSRARLHVLPHQINQQTNCFRFEVDVTVQRQQERVLRLEQGAGKLGKIDASGNSSSPLHESLRTDTLFPVCPCTVRPQPDPLLIHWWPSNCMSSDRETSKLKATSQQVKRQMQTRNDGFKLSLRTFPNSKRRNQIREWQKKSQTASL